MHSYRREPTSSGAPERFVHSDRMPRHTTPIVYGQTSVCKLSPLDRFIGRIGLYLECDSEALFGRRHSNTMSPGTTTLQGYFQRTSLRCRGHREEILERTVITSRFAPATERERERRVSAKNKGSILPSRLPFGLRRLRCSLLGNSRPLDFGRRALPGDLAPAAKIRDL